MSSDDILVELTPEEWRQKFDVQEYVLEAFFASLKGSRWDITFYENPGLKDGERQPIVAIEHPWFDDDTGFYLDAARGAPEGDCKTRSVKHCIHTHKEDLTIADGLSALVSRANGRRAAVKPPARVRAADFIRRALP